MIALSLTLGGCSITPSSIVKNDPVNTKSNMPLPGPKSGAIYSVSSYRPIFEGRRASMVGDILTINFVENTNATANGGSALGKKGTAVSTFTNSQGDTVDPTFNMANSNSAASTANGNNGNTFNGAISATVTDVRPNGNLVVLGEKQVALDQGVEFIRFSGIVNPFMITNDNSVASNTIADARIEYRTNSTLDLANIGKIINRFFLSFIPG
jgi:flagellar L-ring protein precursor FlgH